VTGHTIPPGYSLSHVGGGLQGGGVTPLAPVGDYTVTIHRKIQRSEIRIIVKKETMTGYTVPPGYSLSHVGGGLQGGGCPPPLL